MTSASSRWRLWAAPDAADAWAAPAVGLDPLAALEALLASPRLGRRDVLVRPTELLIERGGTVCLPDGSRLRLRRRAGSQLARLAGGGLGRRPVSFPEVRSGLSRAHAAELRLRLERDEVRAVLTDQFAPLDDLVLFPRIARDIETMCLEVPCVARAWATGTVSVIRLTVPGARAFVRSHDALEPGIEIRNSEVGASALTISPLVYRLSCGNVAIASRSAGAYRLRHAGRQEMRAPGSLVPAIARAFAFAHEHVAEWLDAARRDLVAPEWCERTAAYDLANDVTSHAQRIGTSLVRLRREAMAAEMMRRAYERSGAQRG